MQSRYFAEDSANLINTGGISRDSLLFLPGGIELPPKGALGAYPSHGSQVEYWSLDYFRL